MLTRIAVKAVLSIFNDRCSAGAQLDAAETILGPDLKIPPHYRSGSAR